MAVRRGIDWVALGIGSEQYEAAVLAVKVSIFTQMYGYLPFIGHQVGEAGFIILDHPELAAALRGAQNQLIAVGLIGRGSVGGAWSASAARDMRHSKSEE